MIEFGHLAICTLLFVRSFVLANYEIIAFCVKNVRKAIIGNLLAACDATQCGAVLKVRT